MWNVDKTLINQHYIFTFFVKIWVLCLPFLDQMQLTRPNLHKLWKKIDATVRPPSFLYFGWTFHPMLPFLKTWQLMQYQRATRISYQNSRLSSFVHAQNYFFHFQLPTYVRAPKKGKPKRRKEKHRRSRNWCSLPKSTRDNQLCKNIACYIFDLVRIHSSIINLSIC